MWFFRPIPTGLLCFLIVSVSEPAHALQPESQVGFKELVQKARDARKAGNYAKAINLLEAAYEITPKPVLLNNIGKACEELGWYAKAHDAYKRVADDPGADPKIRALDEARMGKLNPLLTQAWIVLSESAAKGGAWVNGAPYRPNERGDFGLPPGAASVETIAEDGETLLLLPIDVQPGRRTPIETATAAANLGQVTIPTGPNRPTAITIDGYRLRAYGPKITRIALKSGAHRFVLTGAAKGSRARVQAQLAPGAMDETLLSEAEYTGGKSSGKVGPLVGLVVGLGAAGFGAWQLADVSTQREAEAASVREKLNAGKSRTEVEINLSRTNDDLAASHNLGMAALVGGLAILAGSTWWWFAGEDGAEQAATNERGSLWVAPSAQGLWMGGTF